MCPGEQIRVRPAKASASTILESQWQVYRTDGPTPQLVQTQNNVYDVTIYMGSSVGLTYEAQYKERNACGWGDINYFHLETIDCDHGYEPFLTAPTTSTQATAYPNPADDDLTVEQGGGPRAPLQCPRPAREQPNRPARPAAPRHQPLARRPLLSKIPRRKGHGGAPADSPRALALTPRNQATPFDKQKERPTRVSRSFLQHRLLGLGPFGANQRKAAIKSKLSSPKSVKSDESGVQVPLVVTDLLRRAGFTNVFGALGRNSLTGVEPVQKISQAAVSQPSVIASPAARGFRARLICRVPAPRTTGRRWGGKQWGLRPALALAMRVQELFSS